MRRAESELLAYSTQEGVTCGRKNDDDREYHPGKSCPRFSRSSTEAIKRILHRCVAAKEKACQDLVQNDFDSLHRKLPSSNMALTQKMYSCCGRKPERR